MLLKVMFEERLEVIHGYLGKGIRRQEWMAQEKAGLLCLKNPEE